MKTKDKIINTIAIAFIGATLYCWTYLITKAMIYGNGTILIDFNYYGEGWIELFLTYASIIFIAIYMYKNFKNER